MLICSELTADAIRLRRLLALMLLQDSRRAAQMTEAGDLILLDEQDRTLWDRAQIDEGMQWAKLVLGMSADRWIVRCVVANVSVSSC